MTGDIGHSGEGISKDSIDSADDAAVWPCGIDRYVPEGWEPRVLSRSGAHRTLLLDHGRRCLVFAPVGEILYYRQEQTMVSRPLSCSPGRTVEQDETSCVVKVGLGGVVRLPDSVLASQQWMGGDIVTPHDADGRSRVAIDAARERPPDADHQSDVAGSELEHGLPRPDGESPDTAPGIVEDVLAGPVSALDDAMRPLDALALLAASSRPDPASPRPANGAVTAELLPGSDQWFACVLEAAADNEHELDTTGCLVPIRLVQRGLTLSRSDRACLQAALEGPFANRARTLYQLVFAGEWYAVSQQGRRTRIIGVHGRVEDRATHRRLVALLALAVPHRERSASRYHRPRTTVDTPVW